METPSQTTQNHYFVATEHDPEAAEGGKGTAQGFRGQLVKLSK